ncbi:MAG TPA: hypothetical protein VK174_03130, partial [Chitinophagales bacterium]|nr:hypothetical protein [Chitinophagales bacterium]
MMKNTLLVSLVFVVAQLFAQKTNEDYSPAPYKTTTCRSSFEKVKLAGDVKSETIAAYLKGNLPNLKDNRTGLKLNYVKQSPGGIHYSYTQLFQGIEVYQSEIKVNLDRGNTIYSLFDNSENTLDWNIETNTTDPDWRIAVDPEKGLPVLCKLKLIDNTYEILEAGGAVIYERDTRSFFNQDSLVSGKVFNPDPLTTAHAVYGPPYVDNDDATSFIMNSQMRTVTFKANFDAGVFNLESPYVRMRDIGSPFIPPATSFNGEFFFDRSQNSFEDVNAFYHITAMQQHIHNLGFDCADALVDVDAHGFGDNDQSYFSPSAQPQALYFGDGFVDDAEDADVCVHEYGHFVSETAAPGSNNNGQERKALDEGFGDYLAASYSNSLSSYRNDWVFNWDGHNVFWAGRVMNIGINYPTGSSSIYVNGQLWSAVLWCIHNTIGRAATDSLILQAHYAYAQNISLLDGARLLMQADTLLTGGKYGCDIYRCLFLKELHPQNPFINCTVGIDEQKDFPVQFIATSEGFTILNPGGDNIHIGVLNLQGQLLQTIDESQPVVD